MGECMHPNIQLYFLWGQLLFDCVSNDPFALTTCLPFFLSFPIIFIVPFYFRCWRPWHSIDLNWLSLWTKLSVLLKSNSNNSKIRPKGREKSSSLQVSSYTMIMIDVSVLLSYCTLLCYDLFCSVLFCPVLLCSLLFCSVVLFCVLSSSLYSCQCLSLSAFHQRSLCLSSHFIICANSTFINYIYWSLHVFFIPSNSQLWLAVIWVSGYHLISADGGRNTLKLGWHTLWNCLNT